MDYKVIINLMKEMNHTDLTMLEIEEEGLKIRLEKALPEVNMIQSAAASPVYAPMNLPTGYVQTPAEGLQPAATQVSNTVNEVDEKQSEASECKKLVSPMVGTFYMASAPDKPPFVKVGDKVKKGQTICIIEAMKLMNEIESEYDGEIEKVLVNNEEMVEFGQPLFLIK